MATAKKTGIVATVKKAITGIFSSDTKRKPPARTTTAKKTAKGAAKKTAKKAAKVVGKAAKKVAAPVKKAAKKVAAKRSSATKRSASSTSMDRKLISLSEPYEVRDWCKSLGCTEDQLRAAVAAVGNSAAKVRAHLGKVGAF
jgi:hypothetical protein